MFSKDAGGGGAKVPGGAIPVPRLSGAPASSKSPSPKLWRPAADTPSQAAARVSAGVRSQPRDRRGRVDAVGALRSLLGAHSRSTPDRSAKPAPEVTLKEAPGAPPQVLHTSRRPGGRPTVIRFGRLPLGQPLGRGASLPSRSGGGPGHRKDTRVQTVASRGLTGGGAGDQGRVQEASRTGPGGCGRRYSAVAKSGA